MKELTRLIKSSIRQEATLNSISTVLNQVLERMTDREKSEPPVEELLHPKEVVNMLNISPSTFYRYRKHNLLTPVGPGGRFFRKAEVLRLSRCLERRK